jgi:glycogen phosphorylase
MTEIIATSPSAQEFKQEFLENLFLIQGTNLEFGTLHDCSLALAYTVRQYMVGRYLETRQRTAKSGAKVVAYFSAEYLLGRQLGNALLATGLTDTARQAVNELGLDLDTLEDQEVEPGLGNGGLGRLAACYMDSLAALEYPAIGYGIRYEYGIFRQGFSDGWQVEQPDHWLTHGDPWTFPRPERAVSVGFGGQTQWYDNDGVQRVRWTPERRVLGVPYNLLVPGLGGTVNAIRLWSARAANEFNLSVFNQGDYEAAVEEQTRAENISKVLYPDDSTAQGRELRLQQQYFFTACSLADLLRERLNGSPLEYLPERIVVQLNDTHPTIAIPELMRLLIDEHHLGWEPAWEITRKVFAYTCHTLLPEALETWPLELFARLLPRHTEIILEINQRFLEHIRARYVGDEARVRRMSLVDDATGRIRMAHLAVVGSFKVNGVAELHSQLLRENVLADFAELWPDKFGNITNGITPRRFLRLANPDLAGLIDRTIGTGWTSDLEQLFRLESHANDEAFRGAWHAIKRGNKVRLAHELHERTGLEINPDAMFDVMVKRLHEYKRQLLKVMHVIALYRRIKLDPAREIQPRVVIFGAKAAPGYAMAKRIIKLINSVADVVNHDLEVGGKLKVVFPANYNVTLAEKIYPAADLSEQISLAGKEASGTGNMKLALNGALTVGTLDGANVEILERVGNNHFFLFGYTEPEVVALKQNGYDPRAVIEADSELAAVLEMIADGTFSKGDTGLFKPILESLYNHDGYLVLADFRSYLDAQDDLEQAFADTERWTRSSIINVARSGFFSSDRAIHEYAREIWDVVPHGLEREVLTTQPAAKPRKSVPLSKAISDVEPSEKPTTIKRALIDKLEQIEGIGPKISKALEAAGIQSFMQLAQASEAELEVALREAGVTLAPSRKTWAKQAALLAEGDVEGFEAYTKQLVAGREPDPLQA